LDYDYRWNSAEEDRRPWQPEYPIYCKSWQDRYPNLWLFRDATGYRRDGATGQVWTKTVDGQWRFQWAHRDGGNVALANGAVVWIRNVDDPNPWNFTAAWPGGGVTTMSDYYGIGMDLIVRQAGY
jgi:hypothetical protein